MLGPTCTNWESSPTRRIIPKNMAAHSGDRGMEAMALGYAMKARPGPGEQVVCLIYALHKVF